VSFGLYLAYLALTYLRPIEAFAPQLAAYRPMLVLAILTLAVSIFSALARRAIAARAQHGRLLAGFVAAMMMSHLSVGRFGSALDALVDFMPSVILFVTTVANVTDLRRLKTTCAVVVFCTVALGAAGIASYHTGFMMDQLVLRANAGNEDELSEPELGSIPADDTSGAYLWRVRSLGYFSDPNDFAQAIVIALPLLTGLAQQRAILRNLVAVGLPGATLLYTIFLTHSRGALLGLGSLFVAGARRTLGTAWTLLLLAAGVAGAVAVNFTGGRGYTANEESAGGRIDAWSQGLAMLRLHPLFGVGYHMFTDYHPYTAHNSYVLCFSEMGLFGYVLWLGMLVVVFKDLNAAVRTGGDPVAVHWANSLRASLVGFLTCAVFLSRAYEPLIYEVLALCIAATYCARQQAGLAAEVSASAGPTRWLSLSLALAVGSIAAVYMIVVVKTATIGRSI
jgi:putative inorganic carbon (HCO3(-)) transporter